MSEFVESLNDVFYQFGPVSVRRMFGGFGVFHDGLMFGLVADDVLYLKVDEKSVGRFLDLGLEPFEYQKNGARIKMSYYMAPESIHYEMRSPRTFWDRPYGLFIAATSRQSGKPGCRHHR